MKIGKKVLSLLLTVCMTIGIFSTSVYAEEPQQTSNDFYKIVHLDAGRKYFSVDSVKSLIDRMYRDDYNQLQLAFGNAGLRFLLNDMSIQVSEEVSYGSDDVKVAITEGNKTQNNSGDGRCWTETDMQEILNYASSKGIEIVPMLNMPGHMNAILNIHSEYRVTSGGKTSTSTIDLNNEEAYQFGLALLQKYVNYFKGKVNYFSFGADEYANDLQNPYFSWDARTVDYSRCVAYMNGCADIITKAGMTPRAFNDNICYDQDQGSVNKNVQVCYWSKQWASSRYANASKIKNAEYTMINTNQDWYYVPGNDGYSLETAVNNAKTVPYTQYRLGENSESENETVEQTNGAMLCIWNDNPNALSDTEVVNNAAKLLDAFAEAETNSSHFTIKETEPDEQPVPSENKTITVTKGGTVTENVTSNTISAGPDANIASAEITTASGTKTYTKATTLESGKSYLLVNQGSVLTSTTTQGGNSTVSGLACVTYDEATDMSSYLWTFTQSGNYYTVQNASGQYLTIGNSSSGEVRISLQNSSSNLRITSTSDGYFNIGHRSNNVYLDRYNAFFAAAWPNTNPASSANEKWELYEVQDNPVYQLKITGVAIGTTTMTVGNTIYTINVVEEDLSQAKPLTIQNYITNRRVTGEDNNATSKEIAVSQAYGESGVDFSTLVSSTGTFTDGDNKNAVQEVKFWIGRYQTGDQIQKEEGWSNHSHDGEEIQKVRYYGGTWSIYNGTDWIAVDPAGQITAFYIQETTVTDEVTTYVVDWGQTPSNISEGLGGNYAVLDFTVKYESGGRNPDKFANAKTLTYNSNGEGSYATKGTAHEGYRLVNEIYAEETANYEVYMITVTPSSKITDWAKDVPSSDIKYSGEEKVVWVDDEKNLGDFTDVSTHYEGYSVGGEPVVPKLYIQEKCGMLVTYYVRAKVTEDSLSVHYIDETSNQEFYDYNIAVAQGTLFDEGIGLNSSNWKGNLENGTVTNLQNVPETVSADLSTMSMIGAQYRYSDYTCTKVIRSDDGKAVYLYYTFENTHKFVVDFGLPLQIRQADLGLSGGWTSSTVRGAEYGTAVIDAEKGTLTYTPTSMLQGMERLTLNLTETKDGKTETVAHQIYIYPATSVYYEEGFATYSGGWFGAATDTPYQATEQVGNKQNSYGFDASYDAEQSGDTVKSAVQPSNNTQATSTAYGDKAEFTFTGTGVDIYANCTPETGRLYIDVTDSNGKTVKMLQVKTALINGDTDLTAEQAVTGYNVPIASLDLGTKDTYRVRISHMKSSIDDTGDTVNIDGFRVYNTMGFDDSVQSIYKQDKEENPSFTQVRDLVLSTVDLNEYAGQYGKGEEIISQVFDKVQVNATGAEATGAILNDNTGYTGENLQDLIDNGPKNEVYLRQSQTIVLNVNTNRDIQIGLKALNAATTYKVNGGEEQQSLNTSTDMFYTVQKSSNNTITIQNTGSGILSVTLLKISDAPADVIQPITEENIKVALMNLGYIEPEAELADATANINLVDYTGATIAETVLTANGEIGQEAVFSADAVKAAIEDVLPDGYAIAYESQIADQTAAYGESAEVNVQIGKVATLQVTYKKLLGRTVGTATLTGVQTSAGSTYSFSASEIRKSAPEGYLSIKLFGTKVKYGSTSNLTVQVL